MTSPRVKIRELSLWDEDYVAALPAGELDWVEYKGSAKLTDPAWAQDISKYVSAWGNYGGGYIIFGIKDPKSGGPLEIDGGVPEAFKPKLGDWLDDVIPRLVEPPLQKVTSWLIHPKRKSSRIKPGHVLIVIHVPESELAPHQAADRKYYQRIGRKLEPLKHRAITDIAGRRRFPKLRTTVLIHSGGIADPSVFWKLENLGSALALHWKAILKFPTQINGNYVTFPDEKIRFCETEDQKSYIELRIPQYMGSPLFPTSDVSRSFKIVTCRHSTPLKPSIENIRVITFADEMPRHEEIITLASALKLPTRMEPAKPAK